MDEYISIVVMWTESFHRDHPQRNSRINYAIMSAPEGVSFEAPFHPTHDCKVEVSRVDTLMAIMNDNPQLWKRIHYDTIRYYREAGTEGPYERVRYQDSPYDN